ncbi:hypothetical protein CON36_34145 [Bacillus cereus]|uniref:Uncharacterized protein n=1 Tax=Bacillus cereus TaxID=1396 RepID=A0A9X6SSL5_BACCE|nr:hypothetical protein [Bacillus cereus]PDZ94376.1 hypothetical protein CON36_34145 [Bacillus cereus]
MFTKFIDILNAVLNEENLASRNIIIDANYDFVSGAVIHAINRNISGNKYSLINFDDFPESLQEIPQNSIIIFNSNAFQKYTILDVFRFIRVSEHRRGDCIHIIITKTDDLEVANANELGLLYKEFTAKLFNVNLETIITATPNPHVLWSILGSSALLNNQKKILVESLLYEQIFKRNVIPEEIHEPQV